MIKPFKDKTPQIDDGAYVADSAAVIGEVKVSFGASVWENAVLRGDEGVIFIGKNSNVQDNCTLHCDKNFPVFIGENVTVGHNAVVHGATVEDGCLIGMGAIILNGARIGAGSIVGAGALVTQNKVIPPKSLVTGSPAAVKRETTGEEIAATLSNAAVYAELMKSYK